jgi:hypothetical protein
MSKDLRSFLKELGRDLFVVEREIDPVNEQAEIA